MTMIFALLTPEDGMHLEYLHPCKGDATLKFTVKHEDISLEMLETSLSTKGITKVISTSEELLKKLINQPKASVHNYQGSYFRFKSLEIVFIAPLKFHRFDPTAKFLTTRFISKLSASESWLPTPKFEFDLLKVENHQEVFETLQQATMIALDIETIKEPLAIDSVSFSGLYFNSSSWEVKSYVLELKSPEDVHVLRKFCGELTPPKVMQNGRYDIAYLTRYSCPVFNYLYDTAAMFHAWYAELPKDLGYLAAFFIRETVYWKDMAKSADRREQLKYNALDTYSTVLIAAAWLLEAPDWAKSNYLHKFPLIFPSHLAEMTGIKRDMSELEKANKEASKIRDEALAKLHKIVGCELNVSSPKQMKVFLAILGFKEAESADETALLKVANRNPFFAYLVDLILVIRKQNKLISTYITPGKEFGPAGNETILYGLNPCGTDTGRNSSAEHHFWCGLQVQNIPQGKTVKQTLKPPKGFRFAEVDLEQAESRDTAYISGDEVLIDAVENSPDFHSKNASMFFGVPFKEIYSVELGRVLNKALRTLAKPVNHGANYNMGASTLVSTMGEKAVEEAKRLLKLPPMWTLIQVAEYLLSCFHKTYPIISSKYYPGVILDVKTRRSLTSTALHEAPYQASPKGWVRYCFRDPERNKLDLNAYVAHPPQSLNAMTLDKAFMIVFYEIALNPEHSANFRLYGQIHDSIPHAFREGHEYLAELVRQAMEIPVTVTCYARQITRTFTVPAAIKAGKDGKGALSWAETE